VTEHEHEPNSAAPGGAPQAAPATGAAPVATGAAAATGAAPVTGAVPVATAPVAGTAPASGTAPVTAPLAGTVLAPGHPAAASPWTPPADRPRARRPAAPERAVAAALVLGAAAALLLPGGPPGLGVPLLALLAAAMFAAQRPRGWRAVHAGVALPLAGCAAVRDAGWLVGLDLLAAAALASLSLVPARSWPGVLRGLVGAGLALPEATGWLGRGLRRTRLAGAGPLARGLVLTAALLAVFVPLLVSADAAFAALLPGAPDVALLPGRAVAFLLGACAAGAAALLLLLPPAEPALGAPARRLTTVEWVLPVAALDLLLAVFVTVQAGALFGGRQHVLQEAGLTYAQHARSGFWQLLAVTALVLAVVAAAARWVPTGVGTRALLGLLCLLTLVVDASALSRLHLYGEVYGLTRLRVGVAATCLWLGVVLVLVLLAGSRRGPQRWLPHGVVLSAAVGLLALTAYDPEAAIARSAASRGPDVDVSYLSSLSDDALPAIDALHEPYRSCVLGLRRTRGQGVPSAAGWTSANLARARTADIAGTDVLRTCYPLIH